MRLTYLSLYQRASELAKVESVVETLRGELAAALKGSSEQKEQIATLRDQLHHYQEKNNVSTQSFRRLWLMSIEV